MAPAFGLTPPLVLLAVMVAFGVVVHPIAGFKATALEIGSYVRRCQMRARTTLLVTALTLAASGAGAAVATATPGPTPDEGLTGACNMTNSHAAFGMFTIAGSHANANGFDGGMITAILNTNGGTVPDNCQGPQ